MSSAVLSLIMILSFIIIYDILIEIYSVLFRLTGLTREKSRFQAISLLTNCGFTTSESEIITSNKTRRRIATAAMITGYSFSVVIVSLIINMLMKMDVEQVRDSLTVVILSFGIFIVIFILLRVPFVQKFIDGLVEVFATKTLSKKMGQNVLTQLDNYGKEAIVEVTMNYIPEMLYNKSLLETNLKGNYNINIMMLKRRGRVIDVTKDTMFQRNDIIVVFGPYQNIKEVFSVNEKDVLSNAIDKYSNRNVVDLIDNYGKDAMAEVTLKRIPEEFKDKTIFKSGLKEKYSLMVLAVKRDDASVPLNKDTVMMENDKITLFGPYINIKKVFYNTEGTDGQK